jgi:uncharacterized protein YjbI with pentapeptide repeats
VAKKEKNLSYCDDNSKYNRNNKNKNEDITRIITDKPSKEEASDFRGYSQKLSKIIVNSDSPFTVGIFGDWGTGKTTMMQMIKSELEKIISWKNIEQDSERNKLKKYIKDIYKMDWIDNAECKKVNDKILILKDPNNYNKVLIDKKKAILKFNDDEILNLKIKKENGDELIYLTDKKILTVWFDAWRYENEEFSALVPLVRTIILHLEEHVTKFDQNIQKMAIKNLIKNFKKMGTSLIRNSKTNIGFEKFGAQASVETDMNQVLQDYKSEGSFNLGQNEIRFYKHISERIEDELKKIRESDEIKNGKTGENVELEETRKFKLVIFIDDLDRCTPHRALDILESIKTFFDIKGIIYVIGMDPQTIDPIIKTKYEKNPKIDGMRYLQKIVQLPFQIPVWNSDNLDGVIESLLNKAGLSDYYEKIRTETNKELIIKATQLNPRDIKRFVNSIVMAKEFFGQNIKNIDQILAIQAFYFHGYEWIDFLERLMPYEQRIKFLMHFILLLEIKSKDITILDDLAKIIKDDNHKEKKEEGDYLYKSLIETYQKDKLLNDIYSELIKIDDNDLFTFLKVASKPLLEIDNIEDFLRIVETTGLTIKTKDVIIIDSQKPLESLQKEQVSEFKPLESLQKEQVPEFNDYRRKNKNIRIHLPYAHLQGRNLTGVVNLSYSFLFKANLTKADLTEADLTGAYLTKAHLTEAYLTKAHLTEADLTGAYLTKADLTGAYLTKADLTGAYLIGARLARATLVGANLTGAYLTKADLTGAYLTWARLAGARLAGARLAGARLAGARLAGANLAGANLAGTDLTKADLTGADLTNSLIINNSFSDKTVVLNANFENALIDNHEFLEHLFKNQGKNIPKEEIQNKQELRLQLESRKLDQSFITELLNLSKLPST